MQIRGKILSAEIVQRTGSPAAGRVAVDRSRNLRCMQVQITSEADGRSTLTCKPGARCL